MKIKVLIAGLLIAIGIFTTIFYVRANQPITSNKISMEAIRQQNPQMLIKELIGKIQEQLEKDTDSFPDLIKETELLIEKTDDPATKAILHSMVAEMYQRYYQMQSWKINNRTALSGFIPEDIREWSSNLFTDKIKEEITASLQPAALLQQIPVSRFKEIMETGKDSEELRPTLYDFLAYRAVEIQPSSDIYEDLIRFRKNQPQPRALVLAEIAYLRYSSTSPDEFSNRLDSLINIYKDKDYSVELINEKLNTYPTYSYDKQFIDSIKEIQYNLAKETIVRFPQYDRINLIKNRLNQLEQPSLSLQAPKTVYPGKGLDIKLSYTNIDRIKIQLYKSKLSPEDIYSTPYQAKQSENSPANLIQEYSFTLPVKKTYLSEDTILTISIPAEAGIYEYVISTENNEIQLQSQVSITKMAALNRNTIRGNNEILVTDYITGKPISGAEVHYYNGQRDKPQRAGTVKTDKNGLALLPNDNKIFAYQASSGDDKFMLLTNIYQYGVYQEGQEDNTQIIFMTDRGIYRPGQTVYFKGIAYQTYKNLEPTILTNQSFTVIFRDANGKEIAKRDLKTNEYGSLHGEFIIPTHLLNGTFTIETGNSRTYFQVEEYKRPTFKVEVLPLKDEVLFNAPVTLRGSASSYSGVKLTNGQVNYRIMRYAFWPRMSMYNSSEQIVEGNTTIDSNGEFFITFTPEPTQRNNQFANFQSYQVIFTVTDSKGESQMEQYHFSVGKSGIVLNTDIPSVINKDSAKIQVNASTYNNEPIDTKGEYTIYSLIEDKSKDEGSIKEGKIVSSGTFITGKPLDKTIFSGLSSARYRIRFMVTDSYNNKVETFSDFILYSLKDKRPPIETPLWLIPAVNDNYYYIGDIVEVTFGSSEKSEYILYEIYTHQGNVTREFYILNNENKTIRFPYKEEYGDAIIVSVTSIRDGKLYSSTNNYYRKQPNRSLTIKPETFRDKLLPGQQETWRFRITDSDSVPVPAELLASMYDASLDQIYKLPWYFQPYRTLYPSYYSFNPGEGMGRNIQNKAEPMPNLVTPEFKYNQLDWQGVMNFGMMRTRGLSYAVTEKSVAQSAEISADISLAEPTVPAAGMNDMIQEADAGGFVPSAPLTSPIRTNFNETAFFYPTLQTDKEGGVVISFTVPESNTTWNFRAFAHTKELKFGQYETQTITQKQIMISPNLPRFVRQGDKINISTQIINQSGKELNGISRIELFDPVTDQPVICLTKSQKPFALATGETGIASWEIMIPAHVTDLLGIRIVAESDEGSDGEQHLIPVLPNEILVTEAIPFYMSGSGTKEVKLSGESSKTYRMTLEVSANPVWYAVQALPTLTDPKQEDAISWFASYYSNTLANSIVTSHPRLKKIIDAWTATGGDSNTLYSNLQKNEELKNVLLQETPWVLEAENETEQKQRLSLLFDINRAQQQKETASQRLAQLQTESGAWSWYKGFYPSRDITLHILKGMAQLIELNAIEYNQQEKEMQIKALNYLDKMILEDYNTLEKSIKDKESYIPTSQQLEYLYVRSSYRDIPELGEAREAIRFFTKQAAKQWQQASLYGKAETALLMQRNGNSSLTKDITAWFRKTATLSEEMGMYWANNRIGENYLISSVEVHTLIMSLFREMGGNTQETDLMKQWLLNQKRTQMWESTPATIAAIYSLLLTGEDWLTESNNIHIQWGKYTFDTSMGELATGYIKETLSKEQITPENRQITISKEGNFPAWGAVYNQYFESIDQIEKSKTGLHIEKKLFVETNSGTQKQMEPLSPQRSLHVGDKAIVRLTIRTDRQMDFVALKDLRAGCFEPTEQISGLKYRDSLMYYRLPEDSSENFFFEHLPVGTYVIEYEVYVSRAGEFSGGISTIQCLYAPEFTSHTEGNRILVDE